MHSRPTDFPPLEKHAEQMPAAIGLEAPGRAALSYAELCIHLRETRSALSAAGVVPGDVTVLALPNGPEFVTALLATSLTGACAPLDSSLTGDEYSMYFSRLGARTLVIDRDSSSQAIAAARACGLRIVTIETEMHRAAGFFRVSVIEDAKPVYVRQTDAALLLFTSATTGAPKLVPLSWSNVQDIALRDIRALELTGSDRLLNLMPMYHTYGLYAVLTSLFCGGAVLCAPLFESSSLPAWLDQFRPTVITSGSTVHHVLLSVARAHPDVFRQAGVRMIRSSGGSSDPELLAALENAAGVMVLDGYGLTETGGVARSRPHARKPGSVGQSNGLELGVVDHAGNLLHADAEGELVVRGPITAGYLDDAEANQEAFRDGWFYTGDIVRIDGDGFLFITGRLKEMINRGGQKVLPQEVDNVLLAHPAVSDAAAFAIPHRTLTEDVAAAVVLRNGDRVSQQDLRRFATERLASFKVPRRVMFVERIPRTVTGKPQRAVLAQQFREHMPTYVSAPQPLGSIERELIAIWKRILNIDAIDIEDDFVSLGGDSLSAAMMLADVQATLRTPDELGDCLVEFFDDPTIANLARIVANCGAAQEHQYEVTPQGSARILAVRREGLSAPLFCFPASSVEPYYVRHLAVDNERPFFIVCHGDLLCGKRLLSVEEVARASVSAIRRARPRGPYIFAGHCYGGVVAFEAALQLMAEGEQIYGLALFDAATPGYPKIHRHWRQYLSQVPELAANLGRRGVSAVIRAVRDHAAALGRIVGKRFTGRASRVLAGVGSDALIAARGEVALHGMAMWEYSPQPFSAPIIHFIADEAVVSTEVLSDPRLGWQDFARSGLEVHSVPGGHDSMFLLRNVQALGRELNLFLRRCDASLTPRRNRDVHAR